MSTIQLLGKTDKMLRDNLQWTNIPCRGSSNTPSCFMLQEPRSASTDLTDVTDSESVSYFDHCADIL